MSTAGEAQPSRGPKAAAPRGMREADAPTRRKPLHVQGRRE
jgi:hypothetical protein